MRVSSPISRARCADPGEFGDFLGALLRLGHGAGCLPPRRRFPQAAADRDQELAGTDRVADERREELRGEGLRDVQLSLASQRDDGASGIDERPLGVEREGRAGPRIQQEHRGPLIHLELDRSGDRPCFDLGAGECVHHDRRRPPGGVEEEVARVHGLVESLGGSDLSGGSGVTPVRNR